MDTSGDSREADLNPYDFSARHIGPDPQEILEDRDRFLRLRAFRIGDRQIEQEITVRRLQPQGTLKRRRRFIVVTEA